MKLFSKLTRIMMILIMSAGLSACGSNDKEAKLAWMKINDHIAGKILYQEMRKNNLTMSKPGPLQLSADELEKAVTYELKRRKKNKNNDYSISKNAAGLYKINKPSDMKKRVTEQWDYKISTAFQKVLNRDNTADIEKWIKLGANKNQAFMWAFKKNNLAFAEKIIKGKKNLVKKQSRQLIQTAILANDMDRLKWVFTHGGSLEKEYTYGNPFYFTMATKDNMDQFLDYLIGKGLTLPDDSIHVATYNNKTDLLKKLINLGADVNHVTQQGLHPLEIARLFKHTESAKVLQENGSKPFDYTQIPEGNIQTYLKYKNYRQLFRKHNYHNYKYALANGLDANVVFNRTTPLLELYNDASAFQLFLEHGADINQSIRMKGNYSMKEKKTVYTLQTPLSKTIESKNPFMVKFLLEQGADPYTPTQGIFEDPQKPPTQIIATVLDLANEKSTPEIVKLVEKAQKKQLTIDNE